LHHLDIRSVAEQVGWRSADVKLSGWQGAHIQFGMFSLARQVFGLHEGVPPFTWDSYIHHLPITLYIDLVNIAPAPVFAGLERLHNGVLGGMEVFGGMPVLGVIAAANMPTFQTDAQMNPSIADLEALLTALRAWRHVTNLIQVSALPWLCHG